MKIVRLFLVTFLLMPYHGFAQTRAPSTDDMVEQLSPERITRSWSRGVTVTDGVPDNDPPSIDLYINFEFDSDRLDVDASIILDRLGNALNDPKLANYRFLIAGHTDAKGTDEYNSELSHKRANAVVNYLLERHQISRDRLRVTGYGETKLLDPTRPEDGINRRVQIVNLIEAAPQ